LYIWQAPECVRDNSKVRCNGRRGRIERLVRQTRPRGHDERPSRTQRSTQGLDQSKWPIFEGPDATEGAVDQQHTAGGNPKVEKLTDELGFSPFVLHDIALHR